MAAASPLFPGRGDPGRGASPSAIAISVVVHVLAALALMLSPRGDPPSLPPIVSVELVAPLAANAPPPAAASKPKRVVPVAAPPAPKKTVLPKTPTKPAERRVTPKPRPKPAPPKPQELEYDDALASLRSELGESQSSSPIAQAKRSAELRAAVEGATGGDGAVDPVLAAWVLATRQHVRRVWITPPEFLDRGLTTDLRVRLAADGTVLGAPEVVRSSGDPFFDENALRALRRASPLPAPPEPGEWPFRFEPEGGS